MSALIYCPFPDRQSARDASGVLLGEKLIACSNLIGTMESHFIWEGKPDCAEEIGVIFKTDDSLLSLAINRLGELHPYDTPAIIGWRCDATHPATAAWLSSIKTDI
jgi:periplasmic divalent cation tolerance protein